MALVFRVCDPCSEYSLLVLSHLWHFKTTSVIVHAQALMLTGQTLAQTPHLPLYCLIARAECVWGHSSKGTKRMVSVSNVPSGRPDLLRCYLPQLAWSLGSACPTMSWSCYTARLRVLIGMPYQGLKLKIKYSEHQCFLDD